MQDPAAATPRRRPRPVGDRSHVLRKGPPTGDDGAARVGTRWFAPIVATSRSDSPACDPSTVTTLRARIRYRTNGFWIHPDLLGWQRTLQRDGAVVQVRFPIAQDEFTARDYEQEAGLEPVPSFVRVATFTEPGWDNATVAVLLLCLDVTYEGELREKPDEPLDDYLQEGNVQFDIGKEISDEVAFDFLRWIRARTRQPWLGLLAEKPCQYGRGGLWYADTEQEVGGFGPVESRTFRSSRLRLEADGLGFIHDRLAIQDPIPVADELLADAWHLGSSTSDLQRAVIVAGIAVEVRTEQVMRERVAEGRAVMLDMLLRRTSTPTFILDELMLAAFGVSLRANDRALFDRVRELSRHRNAIVHEGRFADGVPFQGEPALIASQLFAWLDAKIS